MSLDAGETQTAKPYPVETGAPPVNIAVPPCADAPPAQDESRFPRATRAVTVACRLLHEVSDTYDRTTLRAWGAVLSGVSAYQTARSFQPKLPNLGEKHGSVPRELIYNSGEHFGPSLFFGGVGLLALRAYDKIDKTQVPSAPRQTSRDVAAAFLASVAANGANEFIEQCTHHNVIGRAVVGEFSVGDIGVGALLPVAVLSTAALAQCIRRKLSQSFCVIPVYRQQMTSRTAALPDLYLQAALVPARDPSAVIW